jgi:hypothetical protein
MEARHHQGAQAPSGILRDFMHLWFLTMNVRVLRKMMMETPKILDVFDVIGSQFDIESRDAISSCNLKFEGNARIT